MALTCSDESDGGALADGAGRHWDSEDGAPAGSVALGPVLSDVVGDGIAFCGGVGGHMIVDPVDGEAPPTSEDVGVGDDDVPVGIGDDDALPLVVGVSVGEGSARAGMVSAIRTRNDPATAVTHRFNQILVIAITKPLFCVGPFFPGGPSIASLAERPQICTRGSRSPGYAVHLWSRSSRWGGQLPLPW